MVDAVERIVNLALYLAASSEPVRREVIRAEVAGYPADQALAAFLRTCERDKEDLREAGFAIETDEKGAYWLDKASTFTTEIELSEQEAAALRAAGSALADDPAFPFAADLRLALAKLASDLCSPEVAAISQLADEDAKHQGELASRLNAAVTTRKRARFAYTTAAGATGERELEPYGLFVRDGRWYVTGRDTDRGAPRTFALERIRDLKVNTRAAKTPDFDRPADFDVAGFILLPFQYGSDAGTVEARLRFGPSAAWRAEALTLRRGTLETSDDGADWTIPSRDSKKLAAFVIENGPDISLLAPDDAVSELSIGLERVIRAHG
ncbi:MAG: WYL domain-containing protein [Coriobacteriales bacterium]|nr:WYL domain-containing protein [Coriobacteriales bacterium]